MKKIYAGWQNTNVDFVKIPDTAYFCTIDREKNVEEIYGISAITNGLVYFEESEDGYDERLKKL